jgi:probable addiction module antidote protein
MKPYTDYHKHLIKELKKPEEAIGYLNAALEDGDLKVFLLALRNVSEAYGNISELAKKSKLPRVSLYRITSQRGNPTIENVAKLIDAFGLRFYIDKKQAKPKMAA